MNSNERILTIFTSLMNGERFTKNELITKYDINERTLQRDFALIRSAAEKVETILDYDPESKIYSFTKTNLLDPKETLAVAKILLESRAFNTSELTTILNHLLETLGKSESKEIKQLIANELFLYEPLSHQKDLIDLLWRFSFYIRQQTVLNFKYKKNRGQVVIRTALPVSLFFSEYYFYVLCYNPTYGTYLSYRLDRFLEIEETKEKIKIPYKDRLQDGEMRKKIHFMYAGKEVTFTFQFWGIVEAALDRLPESRVIETLKDSVIIEATAYDTGVMMWLLSQGVNVKVLSPEEFVERVRDEVDRMMRRYEE